MTVYIKGMGNISPQKTWDENTLLVAPLAYTENRLLCVEPDYGTYIDARQIRRMSRAIKMGVASAFMALKQSKVSMPDGIITATGYGCLEDTGIFLTKMIENKEDALNPTPFIQSTHNTIGSQIALLLQCQAYNQTYTQGSFSFESALLDGMLQLSEAKEKNLLVGGIDEITDTSHRIQNRFGVFRKVIMNSLDLFKEKKSGTVNGEGAAFFVLSGERGDNAIASINAVAAFYDPVLENLQNGIMDFLSRSSITPQDIDFVLSGKSGDSRTDRMMDDLVQNLFPSSSVGVFKHLCGEYPVASAFACWAGARMLHEQHVPESIMEIDKSRPLKTILIFNQYFRTHYSLIVLKAC